MGRACINAAVAAVLLAGFCMAAADRGDSMEPWGVAKLKEAQAKLRPLHRKLAPPGRGDWLANHPEPGQTFDQYIQSKPVVPTAARRTIYVQPLGDFTEKQGRIIALAAEYIGLYFNLPVKTLTGMPLSVVPAEARRAHPTWGVKQVLSTWVLDKLLKPRVPKDAFALIAFTSSDLWPGEGWNFVFGQASLRERVGVWSIDRFGDPSTSDESFRLCLRRTMETGTHELGHMFSMFHCTAYECVMCGSNSLAESDRRPVADCPECMAKACWATHADPAARYAKLADFCDKQGLKTEAERFRELAKPLGAR